MRIYNPDGGQAEFSGNGSRIAVSYLCRRDDREAVTIETVKGVVSGAVDGTSVTIDAGRAALTGDDHAPGDGPPPAPAYTFVNVGNPHCVIRADDVDELDLAQLGPAIEHHSWFPNRANVEFYRPMGPNDIRMRVWERGAGETLSSGQRVDRRCGRGRHGRRRGFSGNRAHRWRDAGDRDRRAPEHPHDRPGRAGARRHV